MKVRELIEELKQLPQDVEVILSRDEEGNGFNPFSGDFSIGVYDPDGDDWSQFTTKENWEDDKDGEPYPGDNAVVMWP